ncbi:MAG: hypothetical protein QM572_17305 [Nocardioides sp.]|uniref:hypothetical protein n=1 Tax=Nocardioides sp. TaxID=35761 RepID=UPI0039E4A7D4
MTAVVAAFVVLALADGACSGLRASFGRTGLVRHRARDVRAAATGVGMVAALLVPASVLVSVGSAAGRVSGADVTHVGRSMLMVLAPYAVVVSLALAAYGLLGWRQRYLAMTLILGPCTLVRPPVAVLAAAVGVAASPAPLLAAAVVLGVAAVLLVEPLMNRPATSREGGRTRR